VGVKGVNSTHNGGVMTTRFLKIIKGSWVRLSFILFWILSFIMLLFVKDFSLIWKLSYIGFIILLTVITIFRMKEAQKEWYKDDDDYVPD
jgi:hypothetical protein